MCNCIVAVVEIFYLFLVQCSCDNVHLHVLHTAHTYASHKNVVFRGECFVIGCVFAHLRTSHVDFQATVE